MSNQYPTFHDALKANDIPMTKKNISEWLITTWGEDNRYFATQIYDGYCFGDKVTGITECWFPQESNDKENGGYNE